MRRRKQILKDRKPVKKPEPEALAKDRGIPLTKELVQKYVSLQAPKVELAKTLSARLKKRVLVSLELSPDQEWYFMVRGSDPVYETWEGVKCAYMSVWDVGSA